MIRLVLTGSIGMGKSTAAAMFADAGVPVWDADDAVARLYSRGGRAVAPLSEIAPEAIRGGAVDREALRRIVAADPTILRRIESVVHPLVAEDRTAFLESAEMNGHPIALCVIPLLFEIGAAGAFDAVLVVSAPAEVQRARVMARPGMTDALLSAILAKQTPDAEKRARADFVIDSSRGMEATRTRVAEILDKLRNGQTTERT